MSTLYVNPDRGSDRNTGGSSDPLKTITQALGRSRNGTMVQLSSGNYTAASGERFPLVVPPGVAIVGNEADRGQQVRIEGSGNYNSSTAQSQNITLLLGDGSTLKGVTVINRSFGGTGVWVESASPTISHNTFTDCSGFGIFVTGKSKPAIAQNRLYNIPGTGITCVGNAKGNIRDNTCQDVEYAIDISGEAAPLLVGNQILANRWGIMISGNARPVLRHNAIERNQQGLAISGNALPDLGSPQAPGGNRLQDNGRFDLQNGTRYDLISAGNQLNPTRVEGAIALVASQLPTAIPPHHHWH
ncbi:MAG: DUF1565 domain-containing protein, partial [Coleofasciculaceae cyanobacterium SM2_3_26]|nr:DUF1565 domain-containing protein [Coleofasciculaceae cyanobacterium SM2_3_26]